MIDACTRWLARGTPFTRWEGESLGKWIVGGGCCLAVLVALLPGAGLGGELAERTGRHIRLITDLDDARSVDDLVESFDAAVPQWTEFWQLPPDASSDFRVDAYLIRDRGEFERRGLIPRRLPDFEFGYASRDTVWVIAQPGEYYTRHLLLHEGMHAFVTEQFGGPGPTWFMEGTAELLATHRGRGISLRVGTVPRSREEVPYWGRFKLMADRRDEAAVPTIETVMRQAPRPTGDAEDYGWGWAAAMLLDQYPDTQEAFQAAARGGRDRTAEFTRQLYRRLQSQWPIVVARWRMLTHELDYGFDWERERIDVATSDPLWDGRPRRIDVRADRGWQSLGVRFPAGSTVTIDADGRCTIADTTKPWISEPTGVTIRYHRGRPLGQLLVCTLPCESDSQPTLQPLRVEGYSGTQSLTIEHPSWLLLRINDAVGELEDNQAGYRVSLGSRGDD